MINSIHLSILAKIRDFIQYKNLEPGDKLPAERALSERFEVSRRNIREVISTLESYELLRSIPQSGTIIGNIGQTALLGIIDNILELKGDNFNSLLETRIILELETAKLAAERSTKKDIKQIEKQLNLYKKKALNKEDSIQEDILFHLSIAKASGNNTLNSLMLQITPKLITVFEYNRINSKTKLKSKKQNIDYKINEAIEYEIQRHTSIFEAIKDQNPKEAVACMEYHFKEMLMKLD